MTANTYKPEQITALYARLSQEDALDGDSNSIVNQKHFNKIRFSIRLYINPVFFIVFFFFFFVFFVLRNMLRMITALQILYSLLMTAFPV